MARRNLNRLLAAGAFAVTASVASAQYASEPFFDWTVVASQAYGLEMAAVRLSTLDAIGPPYAPDFIEVVEQMAKGDFARFGGTLAERDPDLAADLHETLAAFEEVLEDGDDPRYLLPTARTLLAAAYDLVIDPALRETPAYKGIVMAQLLLFEGGVSEGYEEAAEELWAFATGWGALQRVKELWAEIEPLATDQRRDEARQLLALLDALYPTAQPPDPFVGKNPEEAEAPAQLLMGILEEVVSASLYSGRDLARLSGQLGDVACPACAAYDAGNEGLGTEVMMAVADHYLGETTGLANLLDLFAPEVNEAITEHLEIFVGVFLEEEEDEDGGASDDDVGGEPVDEPTACRELIGLLGEARVALGG